MDKSGAATRLKSINFFIHHRNINSVFNARNSIGVFREGINTFINEEKALHEKK
jgi:hypothetical protein